MKNNGNKDTKKAIPILVAAIIFFSLGPIGMFILIVAAIIYFSVKAKANSTGKDIFKSIDLSSATSRDKIVDNIRDNIRDSVKTAGAATTRRQSGAQRQQYAAMQRQFRSASLSTAFEPKGRLFEQGSMVDMLERQKREAGYVEPDLISGKNPFEK